MGLPEQVKNIIDFTPMNNKEIASKAGVCGVTIYKMKSNLLNVSIFTLENVLKACGYKLRAVPDDDVSERMMEDICDNYCKWPVTLEDEEQLQNKCDVCPLNRM